MSIRPEEKICPFVPPCSVKFSSERDLDRSSNLVSISSSVHVYLFIIYGNLLVVLLW